MKTRLLVAFDVDDTLTVGNVARTDIVRVCKALYACGRVDVMIWSGGGKQYAEMWRDRLKLPEGIPCYSKFDAPRRPDIAFDDGEEFDMADKVIIV